MADTTRYRNILSSEFLNPGKVCLKREYKVLKKLGISKMKIVTVLVSAILLISSLTGCVSATVHGWSGVAVSGNNLYVSSFSGVLVGVDASTRSRLFNDYALNNTVSGGFLGCGAGTVYVNVYATPIVSANLNSVFVNGYDGRVYSIDAIKGTKNWVYPVSGELTPIIGGSVLQNDKLYFGGSNGKVYCIDATTGETVWNTPFTTGDRVWATGVADDTTLYIGSYDKNLYALNLADGTEEWHFTAGGAIMNQPILKNGILYFGSFDRYFYAVNASDGTQVWKSTVQADKWYWANPVLSNNVIFASNMDGKVYSFNIADGTKAGDPVDLKNAIASTPVLAGNKLILATENGKSDSVIYSIDTTNYTSTQIADLKHLVEAPLTEAKTDDGQTIVYIHTQDNYLYALNADTQVVLWSQPVIS
jgi:eukaryotic-like serine/threonine-protein kinase